jgi:hypothetical protein
MAHSTTASSATKSIVVHHSSNVLARTGGEVAFNQILIDLRTKFGSDMRAEERRRELLGY